MKIKRRSVVMATVSQFCTTIRREECLELNFTTPQSLNKLSEHIFGIWNYKYMKNSNSKQMSQFQNEAFQVDFVKCLVQTRRLSVAMANYYHFISMLSYFLDKLLHILDVENFVLSKSICS